jgi:hypothetical protein
MHLFLLLSSFVAIGAVNASLGQQIHPRQSSCCPNGNDFQGDLLLACQDPTDTVNYGDGQCYNDWEISCGSSWGIGNIIDYQFQADPSVGDCFAFCQNSAPGAYALSIFNQPGAVSGSEITTNQCQCMNLQSNFVPETTFGFAYGFATMYAPLYSHLAKCSY